MTSYHSDMSHSHCNVPYDFIQTLPSYGQREPQNFLNMPASFHIFAVLKKGLTLVGLSFTVIQKCYFTN